MNGGFIIAEKAEYKKDLKKQKKQKTKKPAMEGDKEKRNKPIHTISPIKT